MTQFDDFDITFPSIGPDGIVFQAAGGSTFSTSPSEKPTEVPVRVVTDETTLRPGRRRPTSLIQAASVSPTGKRAVFEARGDVVTVPAEFGAVVNVTPLVRASPSGIRAGRRTARRWRTGATAAANTS